MVLLMGALFGTIILLPIYRRTSCCLEPLQTGLILLPGSALMGLLAPWVGRLFDKVGPRPLLVPGTIVVSAALWGFAMFDETTPWQVALVAYLALGLGLAFTFTPLFTTSMALAETAPLLRRQRHHRHGAAAGWRRGNRTLHRAVHNRVAGGHRNDVAETAALASGTALGVHGGSDHVAARHRRRVLRAQARSGPGTCAARQRATRTLARRVAT